MATEAQIIANRRNAQKSKGPRTSEGKSAVSQNAVKHGLAVGQDARLGLATAKRFAKTSGASRSRVISSESQADFDLYRDQLLDELNPASPMESMLADYAKQSQFAGYSNERRFC